MLPSLAPLAITLSCGQLQPPYTGWFMWMISKYKKKTFVIFGQWSYIYIYTNCGHRLNRAVMPKCYFSKFFLTFNMVNGYFHNLGWRKSRDLIWGLLIKIKEYASQVHPLSLSGLNQTLNFVLLQDFHFRQRSLEEEQRKGTSDITSADNRSTCDKSMKNGQQVFFAKCEITINLSRIKFQLMGTSIPFNSSFYISSFSNLVNLFFCTLER